jgi:hypothetical protein
MAILSGTKEQGQESFRAGRTESRPRKPKVFFLAAEDLATLPCTSYYGGFSCGPPSKMYSIDRVVLESLRKFGRAEIKKKLAARHKQEEKKKRMKEEEAKLARKQLKTNTTANVAASGSASVSLAFSTDPSATGDTKESPNCVAVF